MLSVGLTGSIAVGKSFVCDCFRELGCHILDADVSARKAVEKGSEGLAAVVAEFGNEVLRSDGELDRKKLGAIVFADAEMRERLNHIVHPIVFDIQNAWLKDIGTSYPNAIAIIDAALMIESGGYKRFNKLIVVWCDPKVQLQRLTTRDGISDEDARLRIAAQMPQEEKKKFANILIDTSGSRDEVKDRVCSVHEELIRFRDTK
jgi:dephospho-CoA kinase